MSELLKTSGNQTNFEIIQMSEYEAHMNTKKSNNKRSNRSVSFLKAINSPINNDLLALMHHTTISLIKLLYYKK